MHYSDSYEVQGEKAEKELHKDTMCCFEKILEATSDETVAVRSLSFHLIVVVGDCSRGQPEGSLFNSYYTEV